MKYKAILIALIFTLAFCILYSQFTKEKPTLDAPEEYQGKYGISKVNPDEYYVKYGDIFYIQLLVADTLPIKSTVMASGVLSLYPFADTVMVAGKKLSEVYDRIEKKIGVANMGNRVMIHLENLAPFSFSIKGAIVNSGTYYSERTISLNEALFLAGGSLGAASRKINIIRGGKPILYDLSKFYSENDITMNPLIMQDDIIVVDYAHNYVRFFASDDTLSFVEYVEIPKETFLIEEALSQVSFKHRWSNINRFTIERDNVSHVVGRDFVLQANDDVFVSVEELYVYVTGYVVKPGRFAYNGNVDINFYLSQAGGPKENGSLEKLYIIREHGKRTAYKNQMIQPGDTIYVPESIKSSFISYLQPVATIVSLVISIVILSRS